MWQTIAEFMQDTWLGGLLATLGLIMIRRETKKIDKLELDLEKEVAARNALALKIAECYPTKNDLNNLKKDLIDAMVVNRKVILSEIKIKERVK